MERSQGNGAVAPSQEVRPEVRALIRRIQSSLVANYRGDLDELAHWISELLSEAETGATKAERSRWLSRIEGLRSKAREPVQ
jgi:hypothetical protein